MHARATPGHNQEAEPPRLWLSLQQASYRASGGAKLVLGRAAETRDPHGPGPGPAWSFRIRLWIRYLVVEIHRLFPLCSWPFSSCHGLTGQCQSAPPNRFLWSRSTLLKHRNLNLRFCRPGSSSGLCPPRWSRFCRHRRRPRRSSRWSCHRRRHRLGGRSQSQTVRGHLFQRRRRSTQQHFPASPW